MTQQQQLIGLVRRYVKDVWSREEKLVRHGSAWAGRKAEADGALKALDMLETMAQPATAQQGSLLGE